MDESEEEIKLLSGKDFKPICIPFVGGRGSGKTAFIAAFNGEIYGLEERCGWNIERYDNRDESDYQKYQYDLLLYYFMGYTINTIKYIKTIKTSCPIRYTITGNEFYSIRSILLYDVAGEFFTGKEDIVVNKEYEYCNGLVIVIDPFSIDSIHSKYSQNLSEYDAKMICRDDTYEVITNFINQLHDLTGLHLADALEVPTAVVISKTDVKGLREILGPDAIRESMESNGFKNEMDTEDYICRKFLSENGLANVINIIDNKFPNNRFFACSAIGHEVMGTDKIDWDKSKFTPIGVMDTMQWLFNQIDYATKVKWNDKKFTKKPGYREGKNNSGPFRNISKLWRK